MARLPPVLTFIIFVYSLTSKCGECSTVVLGDPFNFTDSPNCPTGVRAELRRDMAQHSPELVAHRERDVWKPTEDYKDRINESVVLAFSRTEYTDTGLYELECGVQVQLVQLQVVLASEVLATEGGNATLPCYITGGHVVWIKWSRGREMVLERNLSSEKTKYGPGFNERFSLSPDGKKKGNWALILDPVLPEDGGDYFCSFHQNGALEERGDPAAVRMRIAERTRNQTTGCPSLNTSESVPQETAMQHWAIFGKLAVAVIILLILLILLVCLSGG